MSCHLQVLLMLMAIVLLRLILRAMNFINVRWLFLMRKRMKLMVSYKICALERNWLFLMINDEFNVFQNVIRLHDLCLLLDRVLLIHNLNDFLFVLIFLTLIRIKDNTLEVRFDSNFLSFQVKHFDIL